MTASSLYVYWCPICEIQTDRGWHIFRRGNPLIPQTDGEHTCERIKVVREADLAASRRENATLREALEAIEAVLPNPSFRPQWGAPDFKHAVAVAGARARAALAASPAAEEPSRCPRCEGYEATYHTFEGECSAAEEPQP